MGPRVDFLEAWKRSRRAQGRSRDTDLRLGALASRSCWHMCPSVGLVDYDKFQWSRFYPQNQVYIHLFTEVEMKTVSEVDVFSLAPFMLLKISRTAKPICDRMRDSNYSGCLIGK